MSSKKQKTIHQYFSGNTSESIETKTDEKQLLLSLMQSNDPMIGFKEVNSKMDYMKLFKRIIRDDLETDYVKCNNCPVIIKYNAKTGTNSVKRHKCSETPVQPIESIERHLYRPSKSEATFKSDLTDVLVLFIARDMRPINIINGQGFRLLAEKLIEIGSKNPNIPLDNVLPTDRTVSNHIKLMYEKIKEKLIKTLENIESIGITCDHWTQDIVKTSYITLTIQYIINCQIKSRVLATIKTTDKTAITTKTEVKNILNDFNLSEKTKFFTTDNGSAMILAFSDEKWISCSAHNLNLLHKNSFKDLKTKCEANNITQTLKLCKQLVRYFKQSGIQNKLETKLKQSISIRWDSKYLMLESVQKNFTEIKQLALNNQKIYELIAGIDEKILCELIIFLKQFFELRLTLCRDNIPTIHLVLPTKQKMFLLCNDLEVDSKYIKTLKSIYKSNIEKYFKISDLHKISTVLFPPLRHLNHLVSNEEKTNLLKILSNLINDIKTTTITQSIDETECQSEVDLCLKDFIDLSHIQENTFCDQELENYLNFPQNFDFNSTVLSYWQQNCIKYPRLYRIAIRLFSIPATNLSSERNFSAAGLTLTDHRSNLNPNNVNHLLFIKSNFDLH